MSLDSHWAEIWLKTQTWEDGQHLRHYIPTTPINHVDGSTCCNGLRWMGCKYIESVILTLCFW